MSKLAKKHDPWDQSVPSISDSALETVDGKDPGVYKRYLTNGPLVSRELTVEIGVAMTTLSISLLSRIIRAMKIPNIHNGNNKIAIIEVLQDTVIRAGVKELVARMSRATMKRLSLLFSLQNTKQRNIVDCILRIGLPTFLHEKCDIPLFVDFCSTLGLEAGNYISSHLLDNFSSPSHPNPPYIIHHNSSSPIIDDTTGSDTTKTTNSDRFSPKSSVELERELADEIMLLGTEDLLKSLPAPLLHDIGVELELCPPLAPTPSSPAPLHYSLTSTLLTDPSTLVNMIMDHIFDLVPLDEYSRAHLVSNMSPISPAPSTITASTDLQHQIPSSPFLNATENSKKRKREIEPEIPSSSPSSAPVPTSPTHLQAKPSASASKKAKYAEESSKNKNTIVALPIAPNDETPAVENSSAPIESESPMNIDATSTIKEVEVKKGRGGRPAAVPKASQVPPAAEESLPSVSAVVSGAGQTSSAKVGRRGNPVSPPPPAASKLVPEAILKPVDDQSSAHSASEDEKTSPKRRSSRSQTPKVKIVTGARPSKGSPVHSYDDDYEDESSDDSSDDEETRPTSTGKGRAKYQAPPLSNIRKGVTAQDLHNLYNVTDLQDWCKQNKVDHTGKKSAVIKRILYTLDPANTKPPPPKKSRRFSSR